MSETPKTGSGMQGASALLFFMFGTAAGILLAFSGVGYLQDSAALIATVFLAALMVILALGVLVFALRRMIWTRLFGVAEVQIEELANPLSQVAERAMQGDGPGATQAARDLVAMVLARYAWISTRRWLIASLTGLIAAMAALAGTALLFQQNKLIEVQSGLLTDQNLKIAEQTILLQQQVQLAEAERNSALAVEITDIATALGAAAEAANADLTDTTFNVLDPARDLPRALILRITSISRALKPYRFLDPGYRPGDTSEPSRLAMQRLRDSQAESYQAMAEHYGWQDTSAFPALIDRPASPERGQLLSVLIGGGVRNLEPLTVAGLDLAAAYMPEAELGPLTGQMARLSRADFSGAYLTEVDLSGARLDNARFRRAVIRNSSFANLQAAYVLPPLRASDAPFNTALTGGDFSDAVLTQTRFSGAWMLAANLDGALLVGADFKGTELGAATLRGAVVLDADFTDAGLKGTDWDGAVVFGAGALDRLANTARDFKRDRWVLDPLSLDDVLAIPLVFETLAPETVTEAGPAFRVRRAEGGDP